MSLRPSSRVALAAIGLTAAASPALSQVQPSSTEIDPTLIAAAPYITTSDLTNPNGVLPGTAATPSGTPSGYNDPLLGFNSTRYWAKDAKYSGVTQLIMTYDTRTSTGVTGTAGFICTGALINGGASVLTAGHCVNNFAETASGVTTTYTLRNVDVRLGQSFGGNTTAEPGAGAPSTNQSFTYVQNVGAANVKIHPDYSGSVIDQRDIAVVNLNTLAPTAYQSYELYTTSGIGMTFNVVGWGGRGNGTEGTFASGAAGARLRQGLNTFDVSYADPRWLPAFTTALFGARGAQDVYLMDFDNGNGSNDSLCNLTTFGTVGGVLVWTAPGGRPCGTGLGLDEVDTAGGDSGGPSFINGKIAAVTSFGQSFGTAFGDIKSGLNSSFGEFAGMTRVDINASWIATAIVVPSAVPEPSTIVLVGGGLLALAAAARRRQA